MVFVKISRYWRGLQFFVLPNKFRFHDLLIEIKNNEQTKYIIHQLTISQKRFWKIVR